MMVLVDRLGAYWLDGALAALVVLGFCALVMVLCGQPARRCMIARGAILGALAVIPLVVFLPVRRVGLASSIERMVAARASPPTMDRPFDPMFRRSARMIGLAAAAVTLGGFTMIAVGGLGGLRLIRKTVEPSSETQAFYEDLPYNPRRARPRLRVSARVRAPVLVGMVQPTILIPPDLEEPEAMPALRLSLLHEMAHAERRDSWFGLASGLAGALWFFLPPLWWVRAQMRLDQEFLADLQASESFGAPLEYASSLVDLARSFDEEGDASRLGGSALLLRVLMLVRCPYPVELRPPRWWRLSCRLLLAGLTLLSASLSLRGVSLLPGGPPPPSVGAGHGVLQIARLAIESPPNGPDGCRRPYTLLYALPDRFEMVVDVWASEPELAHMAIDGRFLGPPVAHPGSPPLTEGFHRVRIVKDRQGIRVWVANREVPPRKDDMAPSPMLALLPAPGMQGKYRNLTLTW